MTRDEFQPGDPVPTDGQYVALNVLGSATAVMVIMEEGKPLPALPSGQSWKALAAYSFGELRELAAKYHEMAATARTADVMEQLLNVARRFDSLADQRSQD